MNKEPLFNSKPSPNGGINVFGSVKPKKPTVKPNNEKTDIAAPEGSNPALGSGEVKPTNDPLANANVKKPVCGENPASCVDKTTNEGVTFKFDRIWRELTEADDIGDEDDLPIGGETDAADANLDGDSFDDDSGDLDTADEATDDATGEDPIDFLTRIRDEIDEFLAGSGAGAAEDNLLDDDETALDTEGEEPLPTPDETGAGAPPPPPTQNESWQRKTALGPKMSDKAPGKLGKKKGGKMGKGTLKKNIVDGKGKKVPLSKFSPKMSDKVSRLKKGDLF